MAKKVTIHTSQHGIPPAALRKAPAPRPVPFFRRESSKSSRLFSRQFLASPSACFAPTDQTPSESYMGIAAKDIPFSNHSDKRPFSGGPKADFPLHARWLFAIRACKLKEKLPDRLGKCACVGREKTEYLGVAAPVDSEVRQRSVDRNKAGAWGRSRILARKQTLRFEAFPLLAKGTGRGAGAQKAVRWRDAWKCVNGK